MSITPLIITYMENTTGSFKKIMIIAILIGIISGLGALIFFEGLKFSTHFFMDIIVGFHYPDEGQSIQTISNWAPPENIWLILPVICFGALLSGILVYTFAPEAEGHGTDAAIKAFHGDGRVRWRIPLLKAVASILTMSTGGSAGREGPTAQISAGFGSIAADILGLSPRERRIALATGIGAGIGTIFKAPLGGAILAAEILYIRDFESEAIVPAFLASVIGYSIFASVEGFNPIFSTDGTTWSITQIPLFILLGLICAFIGLLYIRTFYGTQHLFNRFYKEHRIPNYLKPLGGAFIIGVIVIALAHLSPEGLLLALGSIGTGYGFLQLELYSMLPLCVLLFLPLLKILTTSLTIGSGGSGGVFAPGLAIGGSTGGAMGTLLNMTMPTIVPVSSVPVFVIVGMIALFGAIANAPIAVMIMVIEMTGDFSLLIPAMGAVAVSSILTGEKTIFIEQALTKAHSPAHRGEYNVEILEEIHAGDVMVKRDKLITLSPDDPCSRVMSLIDETWHTGFPIHENGKLTGIITIGDIRQLKESNSLDTPVHECMSKSVLTITQETTLEIALTIMIDNDIHHIPVVDKDKPDYLVGFITSTNILRAYSHRVSLISEEREKNNR